MDWLTTSTILQELGDYENRDAWRRFTERFRAPITRFARRMGLSEPDAEDAAQETLLAFAEGYRRGQYEPAKGRLRRWLFGIAFRQALAKRQSVLRRATVTREAARSTFWDQVPGEDSAARVWEEEWQHAVVHYCLQRIRQEVEPSTMRAFELVMRQGRTPAEAARELGVPVKSVYNAKYAVLSRLRTLQHSLDEAV